MKFELDDWLILGFTLIGIGIYLTEINWEPMLFIDAGLVCCYWFLLNIGDRK